MAATLLILGTIPALAQEGGPLAALEQRVATLEQELDAAQQVIEALANLADDLADLAGDLAAETAARQAADADLAGDIAALQQADTDLVADIAALNGNTVLDLDGYLGLIADDPDRPTALFEGVNVQITNGATADTTGQFTSNGTGNLIVGFDLPRLETPLTLPVCSDGQFDNEGDCEVAGEVWAADHKSGSHNLIVGPRNAYSKTSGVVFGVSNVINGSLASVTGGFANGASGVAASVSGGGLNTASGERASVSGGFNRTADGLDDWVAGALFQGE